jgi:hypothetical protein
MCPRSVYPFGAYALDTKLIETVDPLTVPVTEPEALRTGH